MRCAWCCCHRQRHLGGQFGIKPPDLASLRTMYRRRGALFEQQDLACAVLGFHDRTEAERRALVRAINAELSPTNDRQRLLQFARGWLYEEGAVRPVVSQAFCSALPVNCYPGVSFNNPVHFRPQTALNFNQPQHFVDPAAAGATRPR